MTALYTMDDIHVFPYTFSQDLQTMIPLSDIVASFEDLKTPPTYPNFHHLHLHLHLIWILFWFWLLFPDYVFDSTLFIFHKKNVTDSICSLNGCSRDSPSESVCSSKVSISLSNLSISISLLLHTSDRKYRFQLTILLKLFHCEFILLFKNSL